MNNKIFAILLSGLRKPLKTVKNIMLNLFQHLTKRWRVKPAMTLHQFFEIPLILILCNFNVIANVAVNVPNRHAVPNLYRHAELVSASTLNCLAQFTRHAELNEKNPKFQIPNPKRACVQGLGFGAWNLKLGALFSASHNNNKMQIPKYPELDEGRNDDKQVLNDINKLDSIIPVINTYIENEQYEKAIIYLKQIISNEDVIRSVHLRDFDYSLVLLTRKIIEYKKGYFLINEIKPLINKLENIKNLKWNSKAYNYFCIGLIYRYIEDYNESVKCLIRSNNEFENLKNEEYLTYIANTLSLIYTKLNDYAKSELFINKTFFHLNNSKQISNNNKFNIWYSSSINAFKSKNYNTAIERLDSASNYINFITNDLKADLYDSYGLTYKRLEQYIKAEECFIKAINYRKNERQVNYLNLSKDEQNYSELLSKIGRAKEAIEMGKKSCELVQQVLGSKSGSASIAYSSLGSIYLENKQYKKAVETYNKALLSSSSDSIISKNELFPAPSSVVYLPEYIMALKGKALALYKMANQPELNKENFLKQSLICYLKAIEQLEKLRSGYQFDEGKLMLSENEREVYNEAVNTGYELYKKTHNNDYINIAFNISERSKAAVLLDKVSLQSNIQEKGDFSVLFTFDQKLRKEISVLEKNISENLLGISKNYANRHAQFTRHAELVSASTPNHYDVPNWFGIVSAPNNNYKQQIPKQVRNDDTQVHNDVASVFRDDILSEKNIETQLKVRLFKLVEIQEKFFELLKNKYPEYYNTWLFPPIITINQVQKKLNNEESFVEYYLSDSAIFSIVISKNSMYFNKSDCRYSDLAEKINNYRTDISTFDTASDTPKRLNSFTSRSYNLYSLFIKPIKEHLNKKAIIISADGIINYLPFETLIQNSYSLKDVDYRRLNYMIFNYQISYAYSATLFNSKFAHENKPKNELLAFAPDYSNSPSQIAEVLTRSGNSYLQGAKIEVRNINSVIKGDVFSDTLATESLFKKLAPDYSIIHLAMHSEADNSEPFNSQLIFENGGAKEDGLLNTGEIYNLKLNSELIVLSACNTGSGKIRNGEGVMSLARAFTYAGCRSVVMTLWSVGDLSSTNLMESFYNELSKGDDKSEALQKAKLNYILNSGPKYSHPHYWAGYVMIGNKSPIEFNSDNKIIYTATASLGIFSLLIFFILRRRKSS